MKLLILTLTIFTALTTSHAKASIFCKKKVDSVYFMLTINGDYYDLSAYSHNYSNSYAAKYKAGCHVTRAGGACTLYKIKDYPTWKDMPKKLDLTNILTGGHRFFSIGGLNKTYVQFDFQKDCKEVLY